MDPTRLFVGLPTFERASMLQRTLESLSAQTHPHMTILVSDDASSDETQDVVRAAMEKDPRIVYRRHEENIGAVANFQYVLEQADAPYFLWMSDDDILAPRFAERLIGELERAEDVVLAFCDYAVIDESYRTIGSWALPHLHPTTPWREGQLDFWSYPYTRCANLFHGIYRTEALRRVERPFHNTRKRLVVGHEVPMLAQVAMQGRILAVPECLFSRMGHFNDQASLNHEVSRGMARTDVVRLYAAIYARLARYALRAGVPARQKGRLLATMTGSALRKVASGLRLASPPQEGVPDDLNLLQRPAGGMTAPGQVPERTDERGTA